MSDLINRQDTIYRQDAIEAIYDEMISRFDIGITEAHELAEDVLSGLPSTEPERKKRNWIWSPERGYMCDNCHMIWMQMVYLRNFCPNCGADMRGEEE